MIVKELIPRNIETGLYEIEKAIHGKNGFILRIYKTNKFWHVVYKV